MRKSRLFASVAAFVFGISVTTSDAALVSRLAGQAVYDTDRNITWLADASYAQTSGYDPDGIMTQIEALAWVAQLAFGGA